MQVDALIVFGLSSVLVLGGRRAFRSAGSRREATVGLLYSLLGLIFGASWLSMFPPDLGGLASALGSPRLVAVLCCSGAIAFFCARSTFHTGRDRPAIVRNLGRWRPAVSLSRSKPTPVRRSPFEYLAEELRSKRTFLKGLANSPVKKSDWR